jgi:arsenite-transporting ATPase
MRIILYLGKGGVGKTTVAAATALRCAQLGYRTLVASTDIAHSLADSFDIPLSAKPEQIAPNLWAQEISVVADIYNYWDTLQNFVSGLISGPNINRVIADELSSFPGMDEIVSLLHINKQAQERAFDRVIIDAAPTGETIRLLTMPDTFRWYAGHLARLESAAVVRALRPFTGRLLKGPAEVLEAVSRLDEATAELRATLSDPEISSYRVVLQPEKMVVREAERAVSYLGLFSYPVDGVIINRILPEIEDAGEFHRQRRAIQARYIELIENNFRPLPIFRAPYYAHEVVGFEALSQLAADCFGEADPGAIFYRGALQEIVETSDGFLLRLPLPFVKSGDVRLRKRGDELFITIGNFKREMILPTVLAKRRAVSGVLSNGTLEILFAEMAEAAVEPPAVQPPGAEAAALRS